MHPWANMETDTFSLPPVTISLMLTASPVTLVTLEPSPIDLQSLIPWLCPSVVSLPAFWSSPVPEWCCARYTPLVLTASFCDLWSGSQQYQPTFCRGCLFYLLCPVVC